MKLSTDNIMKYWRLSIIISPLLTPLAAVHSAVDAEQPSSTSFAL